MLAAFDEQQRRNIRLSIAGGRFERDGRVVRCIGAAPDNWSGIDWADLDETNADEVIAEQVRFFTELGREFEWKYYSHDRPADLSERLRAAGFEPGAEEALMVADIADLPVEAPPPAGIRIVPATSAGAIDALVRLHEEVFGEDFSAFGQALRDRLASEPDAVTPVLAMAGEVPVCGARIDFHEGTEFASLWGGGTLKAWRGYRYLRVDALPASRPILERLGFVRLSTTVPYTFTPR